MNRRYLAVLFLPAVACLVMAMIGGENGSVADMIPFVTFAGSLAAGMYCGWRLAGRRFATGFALGLLCTVGSVVACFFGCSGGFEARSL